MGLDIQTVKSDLKSAGIQLEEDPDLPDDYPNIYDEAQAIQSIISFLAEVYPMQDYFDKLEDELDGNMPENLAEISGELREVAPAEFKALINPIKGERFMVEGNVMFVFEYSEPIETKVGQDTLSRLENNTDSFVFRTHENLLLLIPIFIPSTEKIYEVISGKKFQNISGGTGCNTPIVIGMGIIAFLTVFVFLA